MQNASSCEVSYGGRKMCGNQNWKIQLFKEKACIYAKWWPSTLYSVQRSRLERLLYTFIFPSSFMFSSCCFHIDCVMLKYKGRNCSLDDYIILHFASQANDAMRCLMRKDKRNYKVSLSFSWLGIPGPADSRAGTGQPFFDRFWIVHFLLTKLAVNRRHAVLASTSSIWPRTSNWI